MKIRNFATLNKNDNVKLLLNNSKSKFDNIFILRYSYLNSNKFKYLISVSKKFFKKATTRNKIKRQIRTFIRRLNITKKVNLIIIVKKNYDCKKYSSNFESFSILFNKIN